MAARCRLPCRASRLTENWRVVGGNHAREIRKLAFDQLGHQLDVAETETDLARRHVQRHRLVGVLEQALHFQHRLARHDDLMALGDAVGLGGAVRQAVAVGGYGARTRPGSNTSSMPLR